MIKITIYELKTKTKFIYSTPENNETFHYSDCAKTARKNIDSQNPKIQHLTKLNNFKVTNAKNC